MFMPTIEKKKLILACADLDASPLFCTDEDGNRYGYEPEVAQAVVDELGWVLEWRFLRWAEFVPALENQEVDGIWCGCAITVEREKQFLYSKPYAVFNESLLVKKGSGINALRDLKDKRVGAISGSTNMALAEKWVGCHTIGFDGQSDDVFKEMIDALNADEIDAVVDDEPAFGGVLANETFEVAFTVETKNRWGVAMLPSQIALKRELDRALKLIIDNGKIESIWRNCFRDIPFPEL